MARYQLVVLSNPVDGQEDEYNRWYDEQHLKDILAVDGVVSAQRFKASELIPTTHGYMAVYSLETDDVARVMGELGAKTGTDAIPMSEAFDQANSKATLYADHGPRLER
jgi:hypothetical protein